MNRLRLVFILLILGGGLGFLFIPAAVPPDSVFLPIMPPSRADAWNAPAEDHCGLRVVRAYPHDPEAFTQGLFYEGGNLYEGTGLYGKSSLRRLDLVSGRIVRIRRLSPAFFGEGVTSCRNRIIQLTWRERVGFVYDLQTFRLLGRFPREGEGWGITCDGRRLIVSDGTDRLQLLDPDTYRPVGSLSVRDREGRSVARLNELEFVEGEIFANIWQSDRVARICPKTGRVAGWIHLPELERGPAGEEPNGIAYDARGKRLFITGKLWPHVYEVILTPLVGPPRTKETGGAAP
ncbi:MAG: glutaminyl-peptide cyclotransferase [Syntrophales bacterium]|nr:glutaminyl-peptide cyclotransferase [Syntrophales bacterium]MDD4338960.1 glutaminyl-peptide cyclotransferase [Syntrophales bacterium]HOG07588.1 glutaminyl-peptide cyclotransferase [Syntrophales bacterium]HOS78546.1 glutaminyl-peptide cyclotransferase [Syntrophales bacterium]HPB69556.1 glutaminyl-peptide cyclotransferase [Syntrophales bacterium]